MDIGKVNLLCLNYRHTLRKESSEQWFSTVFSVKCTQGLDLVHGPPVENP